MDNTIRKNEKCVVGLPRCDFVFSSTRSCFIAYGYEDSPLEMTILKGLLESRGIQAIEAGGRLAPGQNAFCAKICSKIITAQFCAVLLNNEEAGDVEIPNANVNMEYGLMIGFNKYVLPFQKANQKLPFNVSGLDTIKYTVADFARKAEAAIDQAIADTQQEPSRPISPDQHLEAFLLSKKALVTHIATDGDRNIFGMGSPLGFNLLNDFSGMMYIYFGNFTTLRPEVIVRRVRMLAEIIRERRSTIDERVSYGMVSQLQAAAAGKLFDGFQIWILVMNNDDKKAVEAAIKDVPYLTDVFSLDDVTTEFGE